MYNAKETVTPLELVNNITSLIQDMKTNSITEYTKVTRMEALTLLDFESSIHPKISDILNTCNGILSSYYLMAVSISSNVNNVNVKKTLDSLNPERSMLNSLGSSNYWRAMSNEDDLFLPFSHTLEASAPSGRGGNGGGPKPSPNPSPNPTPNPSPNPSPNSGTGSGNGGGGPKPNQGGGGGPKPPKPPRPPKPGSGGKPPKSVDPKKLISDTMKSYEKKIKQSLAEANEYKELRKMKEEEDEKRRRQENIDRSDFKGSMGTDADMRSARYENSFNKDSANLATGQVLEVSIKDGPDLFTFNMLVKLSPKILPTPVFVDLISFDGKPSFSERWHLVSTGQIEFIRDFIGVQDLITKHREMLVKDTTGLYKYKQRRKQTNFISAILSGRPSVATASAIHIMTDSTSASIERKMRIKFDTFREREKYFENNLAMMVVIIDKASDLVDIYYKGIDDSTTLYIKELGKRGGQSSKSSDILEMMNSLKSVQAPTF